MVASLANDSLDLSGKHKIQGHLPPLFGSLLSVDEAFMPYPCFQVQTLLSMISGWSSFLQEIL